MLDSRIARSFVVVIAVAIAAIPSYASAQAAAPAAAPGTSRFVTGPLAWTPSFQLREAGVDSNVFNEPQDAKDDLTAGALSQVDSVLTLGILQASTQGSLEYLYFDRYAQERGFNRRVATHLEFPVSRFSPDVTVGWDRVKERSGNEIDTRTPRTDLSYAAGIQTRVGSRFAVTATAGRQKQTYDRGFAFHDVEIAQQLNRETTLGTVTGRLNVTPLTTFEVDASVGRDEFPFKPESATDNTRIDAGFEFAPDAVIRGRASVGYHAMHPHEAVPTSVAGDFAGVTSAVDLTYTFLGVTRFGGRLLHDSNYSISTSQPFYVSTLGALDVLQQLFGPVALNVRAAREKLDYPATDLDIARVDFADTLVGGLSIRVAPQTVIALLYDNSQRRSSRGQEFGYERRRIYTTVTYGF